LIELDLTLEDATIMGFDQESMKLIKKDSEPRRELRAELRRLEKAA
tara:strand:- start:71 stop:208 length:138 start_codon:yes stop_codon:yes gene_type:complete